MTIPRVQLLAHTSVIPEAIEGNSISPMDINAGASDAGTLVEFAGRSCYKSFHRPNPATEDTGDYVANILRQGHGSVLEHVSATFFITGVSRSLTHELVRHRHFAYSELSQRFVDMADSDLVIPPALLGDADGRSALERARGCAEQIYVEIVERLGALGYTRKQAREAARAVLPSMVETRIVMTGNARAWRDFILRRATPQADAEIREVAVLIATELKKVWPEIMQDMAAKDGGVTLEMGRA